MKNSCIAFKLNYCDGGRDEDHVGFQGLCSYENMYYNVFEARPPRPWCLNRRCDCRKYLDEWITWRDLNKKIREGFFPCMDSAALIDWCMAAGSTSDGATTKKIRQGKENHLCIFTTREPKTTSDKDRIIFAMFIMHEIFSGDDEHAGYVVADDHWRLEFRPREAAKLKFWDFYQNKDGSTRWSGLFRYFDDATAVKLLEMAVKVKRGTPEESFAKEFLKHYPYK